MRKDTSTAKLTEYEKERNKKTPKNAMSLSSTLGSATSMTEKKEQSLQPSLGNLLSISNDYFIEKPLLIFDYSHSSLNFSSQDGKFE